jgi:hypothetical protein
MEKKLAQAASKKVRLERGKAKLSDLPVGGKALAPLDPYVPSFAVSALFFSPTFAYVLLGLFIGLFTAVGITWRYLTFRPKGLQYDGPRPAEKEYAFSAAISLSDIKLVQKAFKTTTRHITLNDVMCAVVARTMHEYFEVHGTSDSKCVCSPSTHPYLVR